MAGFAGGLLDAAMMRIVDILYSLPFTLFVILLMVFFGRNLVLLFLAIGFESTIGPDIRIRATIATTGREGR